MNVLGVCGYSGAGKTTLIGGLIGRLRAQGLRVGVVKHAHHAFDIDHEGKDSWRHRQAGACEVVVASQHRLAKIQEFSTPRQLTVHHLLAELGPCDWALVEGFKHAHLPKIEVWRLATAHPVQYTQDTNIVAVATDQPGALPSPTALPVFQLSLIDPIVHFLLNSAGSRYDYTSPPLAQLR